MGNTKKPKPFVLFAGRVPVTESQIDALKRIIGDFEYEEKFVLWHTSPDEAEDNRENADKWVEIAKLCDVVVGILPPTALISLLYARDEADNNGDDDMEYVRDLRVFTPISSVTYTIDRKKQFEFLRLQEI